MHSDLGPSERFYAGLYKDMVGLMSPGTEIFFAKDGSHFSGSSAPRATGGCLDEPRTAPRVLVSFGDSFTYGKRSTIANSDTPTTPTERGVRIRSAKLGIPDVINRGEPRASNAKIMRNLCDFVRDHPDDLTRFFFVVSLTHPSRCHGSAYEIAAGSAKRIQLRSAKRIRSGSAKRIAGHWTDGVVAADAAAMTAKRLVLGQGRRWPADDLREDVVRTEPGGRSVPGQDMVK